MGDSAESLGSEHGIITQVEVDVALERAIGVERGPAAAAHIVEFSRHHDEAQAAEAVIIELDEAGLASSPADWWPA